MPFAGYKDFNACLLANGDKEDPHAYCGAVQHAVEGRGLSDGERAMLEKYAAPQHQPHEALGAERTDGAQLTSGDPDPQDAQQRHHMGVGPLEGATDNVNEEDNKGLVTVLDAGTANADLVVIPRSGSDAVKAGETGQDRDEDDKVKDARSLDASTKQELMEASKKRDALIEQENVGVPVPRYGTGPLGPTAVPKLPAPLGPPNDKGGTGDMGATPPLVAKDKGRAAKKRVEVRQMVCRATLSEEALPDGICGRMTGIGLRYNQEDTYGTTFLPGCLDKSRSEKVPALKVKLYRQTTTGTEVHPHGVDTHVGVVRSVADVGDDVLISADLLDTEHGRATKEYLAAALKNGGTGLSIGFFPHRAQPTMLAGKRVQGFKEVELMEFTITPINSVPGTDVLAVRAQQDARQAPQRAAATGTAAEATAPASMQDRRYAFVRMIYLRRRLQCR